MSSLFLTPRLRAEQKPNGVPDKLVANGAERGLGKEGGCKLVTFDIMDLGLLDGSSALMQREKPFLFTVDKPWII